MLDIKQLRDNSTDVAKRLKIRGFELDIDDFNSLDKKRKDLQVQTQQLQNERNQRSKAIGQAKAAGEDITPLLTQVDALGQKLEANKKELDKVLSAIDLILLNIPNIPHETVPAGKDESDNREEKKWGEPKTFNFTPKSHDELGVALGLMDFATAAKITGSRFVVMKGALVRLQRALTQFMLDVHTKEHGYEEIYVPFIVNRASLIGTGQLPKFEEDLFKLQGSQDYYLTSTGEVPVANTVREQILDAATLPLKYVSHTPCFRSEAGSYGRDTKGMIRQHQFEKVELIWVTKKEDSFSALEQLTAHAETILQKLALPYRIVSLCGGDIGFTAAKTYDLEVWLPSQNSYREISSCSNCLDFQARRMHTRIKHPQNKETEFVHTLNGSGLAVGRTLVAILENGQDEKGRIHLPQVLHNYMGCEVIE